MAKGFKNSLRGHEIEFTNGEWIYSDTKEPTASTWESRSCGHCGLHNTKEDHDGCLGTLQGVMNACCGHGRIGETYVQFAEERVLHGEDAMRWISTQTRKMEE